MMLVKHIQGFVERPLNRPKPELPTSEHFCVDFTAPMGRLT